MVLKANRIMNLLQIRNRKWVKFNLESDDRKIQQRNPWKLNPASREIKAVKVAQRKVNGVKFSKENK